MKTINIIIDHKGGGGAEYIAESIHTFLLKNRKNLNCRLIVLSDKNTLLFRQFKWLWLVLFFFKNRSDAYFTLHEHIGLFSSVFSSIVGFQHVHYEANNFMIKKNGSLKLKIIYFLLYKFAAKFNKSILTACSAELCDIVESITSKKCSNLGVCVNIEIVKINSTFNKDKNKFLFIGRCVDQKNPLLAAKSLKTLRDKGAKTVFCGVGPLIVDVLKIYNGEHRDHCPLDVLIIPGDVVIVTSHYEGYPTLIPRVIALGASVITTTFSTGLNELKDVFINQIYIVNNPSDMASRMLDLYNCDYKNISRGSIVEKDIFDQYSVSSFVDRLGRLYL
jgi:glycosyltransferase involved in cell wall biosynthesis